MAIKLTPERKHAIFKSLANKTLLDVGMEFGFDKHFQDKMGIRQAVNRVYKEVLVEPDVYGISEDVVKFVQDAMAARKSITTKKQDESPLPTGIDKNDIKGMLTSGRDKAMVLMHKKLDRLGTSRKMLDKENIATLAKVVGILFDKSQIVQGEATEHIAVLSKVDDNLTPEQRMNMLVKLREKIVEEKFS
jgi:hypothetical protein